MIPPLIRIPLLLAIAACPSVVYASDYSGVYAYLWAVVVVGITTFVFLCISLGRQLNGVYNNMALAKRQALQACVAPCVGVLMAFVDTGSGDERLAVLTINIGSMMLALLPVALTLINLRSLEAAAVTSDVPAARPTQVTKPGLLPILALLFCLSGWLLLPLFIVGLVLAHTAVKRDFPRPWLQLTRVALCVGYASLLLVIGRLLWLWFAGVLTLS